MTAKLSRAANRRHLRRAQLETWLVNQSLWLMQNAVTPAEAAEFAVADGLWFATQRRVEIAARKLRLSLPRYRDKRPDLSARQWARLIERVRPYRERIAENCATVAGAANYLAIVARLKRPLGVIDGALRGAGVALPLRSERVPS